MSKRTCVDCHFFVRNYHSKEVYVHPLTEPQRESVKRGDFNWKLDADSLSCAMDVWNQGVQGYPHDDEKTFLADHPRNNCFFRKHVSGMLLPAAKELQRREMADAQANRDRKLTVCGILIAALALAVSTALEVYDRWWGQIQQLIP